MPHMTGSAFIYLCAHKDAVSFQKRRIADNSSCNQAPKTFDGRETSLGRRAPGAVPGGTTTSQLITAIPLKLDVLPLNVEGRRAASSLHRVVGLVETRCS